MAPTTVAIPPTIPTIIQTNSNILNYTKTTLNYIQYLQMRPFSSKKPSRMKNLKEVGRTFPWERSELSMSPDMIKTTSKPQKCDQSCVQLE